ncbi:hypothetical protein GIB67_012280, partial [Kingdonia uniflora]
MDVKWIVPRPIKCKWKLQGNNLHILNIDGSIRDKGGYGAVVRRPEGEVLKGVVGCYNKISITIHELQGIDEGLKLVLRLEIPRILVGSDSQISVSIVKGLIDPPLDVRAFYQSILHSFSRLESFKIIHIYREFNMVTNHLLKLLVIIGHGVINY